MSGLSELVVLVVVGEALVVCVEGSWRSLGHVGIRCVFFQCRGLSVASVCVGVVLVHCFRVPFCCCLSMLCFEFAGTMSVWGSKLRCDSTSFCFGMMSSLSLSPEVVTLVSHVILLDGEVIWAPIIQSRDPDADSVGDHSASSSLLFFFGLCILVVVLALK